MEEEQQQREDIEPLQEITIGEVRMAMEKMKNGKAAGDDNLSADIMKKLEEEEMTWAWLTFPTILWLMQMMLNYWILWWTAKYH